MKEKRAEKVACLPNANIFTRRSFSLNKLNLQKWSDFPNYAKKLHDDGLHLFLIFDPAIQVDYDSYKRGVEMVSSKRGKINCSKISPSFTRFRYSFSEELF